YICRLPSTDTAATESYTLSLHDALPIYHRFVAAAEPLDGRYVSGLRDLARDCGVYLVAGVNEAVDDPERFANTTVAVGPDGALLDRKSTRLNSSHVKISYAVFCLKKKIK